MIAKPWRIDEDNDQRVVVKDDRGDTVHHAEYATFPANIRDQMIAAERANCHAIVEAINRS